MLALSIRLRPAHRAHTGGNRRRPGQSAEKIGDPWPAPLPFGGARRILYAITPDETPELAPLIVDGQFIGGYASGKQ
jgi:hypothetical protein